jgi:putative flippase GtrA
MTFLAGEAGTQRAGQHSCRQGLKYLLVGILVYLCDFLTFLLLAAILPYGFLVMANYAAKSVGAGCGFILHRNITFGGTFQLPPAHQFGRYMLLLFATSSMSSALLFAGVNLIGASVVAVKLVGDVLVTAAAFIFSKFFIFQGGAEQDDRGIELTS